MILDIARHKFYEGALYLFVVTILSVVIAFVGIDNNIANATIAAAPLQPAMRDFMLMHPVWSAVIAATIIMTTSMRMTRTTIIHSLFSVGSLATMSLSAVVMMGVGMHGNILSTLMVGFLLSEAINRAGYCVHPEPTLHYMFTACMALGAMPLFDCSMLAPAIVAPVLLLLSNKKPREIVVAYIGLLVPLFAYSYIQWCQGHPMLECAKQLWEGMLTPSALADVDYLSIPRLVMLGVVCADMHLVDIFQRPTLYLAHCPPDMATVADPRAPAHNMLHPAPIYDPCVVHVYWSVHITHGPTPLL